MFLPSFLDYSSVALENKLIDVQTNLSLYLKLTKQKHPSFHLDIVATQFAKDHKVMCSLGILETLKIFQKVFGKTKCIQTIHLMLEKEDIIDTLEALATYKFNPNWQYQFFVGQNYLSIFDFLNNENSTVGIWLDKDEVCKTEAQNYLLMTVFAGKSGQHLEESIKQKALEIVRNNPNKNYILDGGWCLDKAYPYPNLQIVSYSFFWKLWENSKKSKIYENNFSK